jgi:hypothetical protein
MAYFFHCCSIKVRKKWGEEWKKGKKKDKAMRGIKKWKE